MIPIMRKYVESNDKRIEAEKEQKRQKFLMMREDETCEQLMKEFGLGVWDVGGRIDDDGTDGMNWWVFDGKMDDKAIWSALEKLGICECMDRGVWDDNDWDCSGKTLVSRPFIAKRTKTRVLVTQCWGLDI